MKLRGEGAGTFPLWARERFCVRVRARVSSPPQLSPLKKKTGARAYARGSVCVCARARPPGVFPLQLGYHPSVNGVSVAVI